MNLREIKVHNHNTLAPEHILKDDHIAADRIVVDDAVAVQCLFRVSAGFLERRQVCQGRGVCGEVAGGETNLGERCSRVDQPREVGDWCEGRGAGDLPYSVKVGVSVP